MKNKSVIIFTLCAASIFFVSCGSKDKTETASPETETHVDEHANPDEATLTADQIKTIGIEFGSIEQKQLTASLKTNGVLKVPNQNKASINSVYSGVIKSLLVQPGNSVSRGQTIATISNPEFIQVQSEYLSVNSRIVLAEQEYNRQKELNAGNAGALKNLQAADAELKSLRTRRSSLQQQIQLMGISTASLGAYVDLSTVVAEVVDNSRLHLDLFVYEKDLPKIKNKQTIHFTVTNNPGKEYDAEIFSLGSSFENESKAISVHAMVKGDKTGLIDGMNITANISLDQATLPAIPTDAIVNFQGQDFIFIVDSVDTKKNETHFKRIPVVKGTSDVGYSEITLLKDIPAGAKVVIKGSFFILAKQTNTEGHSD
jgi:RND family efflux transporter MFP subunit